MCLLRCLCNYNWNYVYCTCLVCYPWPCLRTVHVYIVYSQSYLITFGIFLVSYPGPLKPILYDHIVLRLHSHTHTLAVLISICWPSPVMAHFYRMRDRWGLHSDVLTWGSNLSVKTRVCVREIAFWCVYIVNKAPTHQVSINNILFWVFSLTNHLFIYLFIVINNFLYCISDNNGLYLVPSCG